MKITKNRELIKLLPREAVIFAKKYFEGKPIVACEVGVFFGEHAKSINDNLNINKLYLIDPYAEYNEKDTSLLLKKAKRKAHKINKKGNEVWIENIFHGKELDLGELDFLYIDGDHTYEGIKKDLMIYTNFVKDGGIIAGHDIQHPPVAKAVIEFAHKNKLNVVFGDRRDWWIIK